MQRREQALAIAVTSQSLIKTSSPKGRVGSCIRTRPMVKLTCRASLPARGLRALGCSIWPPRRRTG